jgi:hypothetical protein
MNFTLRCRYVFAFYLTKNNQVNPKLYCPFSTFRSKLASATDLSCLWEALPGPRDRLPFCDFIIDRVQILFFLDERRQFNPFWKYFDLTALPVRNLWCGYFGAHGMSLMQAEIFESNQKDLEMATETLSG